VDDYELVRTLSELQEHCRRVWINKNRAARKESAERESAFDEILAARKQVCTISTGSPEWVLRHRSGCQDAAYRWMRYHDAIEHILEWFAYQSDDRHKPAARSEGE
jgi:hypothetical protein